MRFISFDKIGGSDFFINVAATGKVQDTNFEKVNIPLHELLTQKINNIRTKKETSCKLTFSEKHLELFNKKST